MDLTNILPGLGVALLLIIADQGTRVSPPSEPGGSADKPICEKENSLHRSVTAAIFLPKSDRLVLGGGYWAGPGELTFCKTTTLESVLLRKDHKLSIWSLAASPDGSKVATGGGSGEVKVYDAASGKV